MNEMDWDALDLGTEMGEAVHRPLAGAPVVAVAPILGKFADIGGISPVAPIAIGEILGLACGGEPMGEIIQHRLCYIENKWFDHWPFPY